MLGVGVADVEGKGAVVGELVGGGAADAEGGVGACYYYYFVFYSTAWVLLVGGEWDDEGKMYGPAESGAMRRILGMFSKVPGSAGLTVSCSLRAWRRCLGAEVMVGGVGREVEWLKAWRGWMVERVAGSEYLRAGEAD